MTRALSIFALWASAAAAMNTNSLAVYCAPPTNAPALSESALHADVYDRVIDMTNLVQLAAIYDMMCERVDVPQWGFTYSRNKRLRTFGGIGTNRNAIAASRVLKYAPLVQLCGDVCDFLKSASATNMGFYTVYPLTFGFDFDDAGNRDTWTDVTTPTGTVSDAYSIGDVVLSPGRDNYGYQPAFGFSADVMQNYDPSSSVIPFWLGALGGVTHYAAPGSLGAGSHDAISRIVQGHVPAVTGGPRELVGWDYYRNARAIMEDGLPRIPYWAVFAQAAELVAPLRFSCFSVNGPVYFQNNKSVVDVEYEISARQILDFNRASLDGNSRFQLNVAQYMTPGSSERPVVTSSLDDAPRFSRSRTATESHTLHIEVIVEYEIRTPTAGIDEMLPIGGWTFVGTEWVADLGEYRDAYHGYVPNVMTCVGTNAVVCSGSLKCRTIMTDVSASEIRKPTPIMAWPSADAIAHGYYENCDVWMFASCEYDDRITQENGRTNMVYDLYGKHLDSDLAPSNVVNTILGSYQLVNSLPRPLETPWGNGDLKVMVSLFYPNMDEMAGTTDVTAYCPVGETPSAGHAWFPQGGEDTWTVEYDIAPGAMMMSEGTGQCKVTCQPPAVMGRVKWNFLDVGPQR